jgi:hypothetical protein
MKNCPIFPTGQKGGWGVKKKLSFLFVPKIAKPDHGISKYPPTIIF